MNVKITTNDTDHSHLSLDIKITDISESEDINRVRIAVHVCLSEFETKLISRQNYLKECRRTEDEKRLKELEAKFPVV